MLMITAGKTGSIESEWLECLNVKIKYKDEFLAYFASDSGQSDFLSIT